MFNKDNVFIAVNEEVFSIIEQYIIREIKKDNRYVSREVNEEVDIRLQLIMWSMIDKLKDEVSVELDYLQVFKLRKEGKGAVALKN